MIDPWCGVCACVLLPLPLPHWLAIRVVHIFHTFKEHERYTKHFEFLIINGAKSERFGACAMCSHVDSPVSESGKWRNAIILLIASIVLN